MTNPRGLVLDPRSNQRLMFWSDWGRQPRIERANMDGTNRQAIITTKLFWPNGLAIDLSRQRLYFADAHLDYIESCDYFGQQRTQIVANDLAMHHPHSLSFFEDSLFWVDRGHSQLIRASRFTPANKTAMNALSTRALTVKVAHQLLQPIEDNPCLLANCEHLCLLSVNSTSGYKCECQIGYVKDASSENRCNLDQSEFLIVLNQNVIGGMRIFANDSVQVDDSSAIDPTNGDSMETPDIDDSTLSKSESVIASMVHESGFLWDRLTPVNDISFQGDLFDKTNI